MMMMTGDHPRSNPTVQIPPWDPHHHYADDPTAHVHSPVDAALAALQRYLPSNQDDAVPADDFSCDHFRMYEFKVKRCAVAKSHDWTECPFAHPGEKARRRDPRRHHYSGSACPDFRRGDCERGDACEYAHGVFESWLHPARYRTQPCKDGARCRRRVCFFAHAPEQLRVLPSSPDASPGRLGGDSPGLCGSSPNSTLYSPSPPASPTESMCLNYLTESMRGLKLNKMKMGMGLSMSPPSWGVGYGSPRSPRPGFLSLPSTPIRPQTRSGLSSFDPWGISEEEEEPAMERVESGQELRERIYAKLGRENSLDRGGRPNSMGGASSVFGWG